jgi:hypothetical protein
MPSPLLPPVIVGPLSLCSSSVRVQAQLPGAKVNLFSAVGAAAPTLVGTGVATGNDQIFQLNAGVTLVAGASVTATQTLGGVTSLPSFLPFVVQAQTASVGNVICQTTPIFECSQVLVLGGLVPGATVQVMAGGAVCGSGGPAADGTAAVRLTAKIGAQQPVTAQQTACGIAGPVTPLGSADSLTPPLPAPTITRPLLACQTAVLVSNVIPGAQVTLNEAPLGPGVPGFGIPVNFGSSSLWFGCPQLDPGASVSASQSLPMCGFHSDSSTPVVVGPEGPVPPPTVVPPLCAGSVTVRLTGLLPGSIVEIFQNGLSLGRASPPASTFDFEVPALTAGDVITATQELCALSVLSNGVTVGPQPASLPTPVVQGPLYACGAAVRVSNLHPGATVHVWSTNLGAPIGRQTVYGAPYGPAVVQADVPVTPLLSAGDQIFAVEHGCGHVVQSAKVPVNQPLQPVPPKVQTPVEKCMRSVTVGSRPPRRVLGDVVPGAQVDVYVNKVWRGSAIATAATVEVPLSGSLKVTDKVNARQSICGAISVGPPVDVEDSAGYYYLTQHFDTARTGWFPYETALTVASVPTLNPNPIITQFVDGTVYAQPLYAHHVNIPGQNVHNVVYVATENDTVYAFDADNQQPALWKRSLIPDGYQLVLDGDLYWASSIPNTPSNILPGVGITSTPVIDCASYTMWVAAKTKKVASSGTTYQHWLYAIDIATGVDRLGSPVEISPQNDPVVFSGQGGSVTFNNQWQLNRPALLLAKELIYIGFGSHDDTGPNWYGWVLAYDATKLTRVGVFCTTPSLDPDPKENPSHANMGSVWQSGIGLAADPDGNVYFVTGNGDSDASMGNYGDTVVKLTAPNFTVPPDFFTPYNQQELFANDWDFGSGGPLILPNSGAMVACGKFGQIYLIDRNNMGKYNAGGPDNVLQVLPLPGVPALSKEVLQPGFGGGGGPGVWGGPAYFDNAGQQFVYYCGNGGQLTAFVFAGNSLTLSSQSSMPFPPALSNGQGGGTTPVVSSDQQRADTGIVWALVRTSPQLQLVAFDATDLTTGPLFPPLNAGPWNNYGGAFTEPTVIQGKVYVPSDGQLNVFGL